MLLEPGFSLTGKLYSHCPKNNTKETFVPCCCPQGWLYSSDPNDLLVYFFSNSRLYYDLFWSLACDIGSVLLTDSSIFLNILPECAHTYHPSYLFSCWDILPAAIRESRHVDGQLRRRRQVPILLLNHRAGKKLNFSPPFPCLLCFNHWIWCCFLYQSFWRRCMNAFGLRPLPFLMVSWYQKLKKRSK